VRKELTFLLVKGAKSIIKKCKQGKGTVGSGK